MYTLRVTCYIGENLISKIVQSITDVQCIMIFYLEQKIFVPVDII